MPAVYNLMEMKHGDLTTTPNAEMNARALVVTENATVGLQRIRIGISTA